MRKWYHIYVTLNFDIGKLPRIWVTIGFLPSTIFSTKWIIHDGRPLYVGFWTPVISMGIWG